MASARLYHRLSLVALVCPCPLGVGFSSVLPAINQLFKPSKGPVLRSLCVCCARFSLVKQILDYRTCVASIPFVVLPLFLLIRV